MPATSHILCFLSGLVARPAYDHDSFPQERPLRRLWLYWISCFVVGLVFWGSSATAPLNASLIISLIVVAAISSRFTIRIQFRRKAPDATEPAQFNFMDVFVVAGLVTLPATDHAAFVLGYCALLFFMYRDTLSGIGHAGQSSIYAAASHAALTYIPALDSHSSTLAIRLAAGYLAWAVAAYFVCSFAGLGRASPVNSTISSFRFLARDMASRAFAFGCAANICIGVLSVLAITSSNGNTWWPPFLALGPLWLAAASGRLAHDFEHVDHLVRHDSLTGLPNRREFFDRANEIWNRSQDSARDVSIGLLDLDFFKAINDQYGHDVGDQALCEVASILRAHSDETGMLVARLGGEEFGMILVGPALSLVVESLDALRRELSDRLVQWNSGASIGVVQRNHGESLSSALRRADEALYTAKRDGRNRVVQLGTMRSLRDAA